MNTKDVIIRKIAEDVCDMIARKVVRKLQQMTKGMQSGDDSYLKNIWDEICVQVQYEESIMWNFYLEIILSLVEDEVKKLNVEIKQCIWFQTEFAIDWQEEDEEQEIIDEEDIADYVLQDFILSMASNWKNKRIKRYLERDPDW